ncbi:MAG: SAM-dependent methyltransferase [Candidatus Solibacter sp.]
MLPDAGIAHVSDTALLTAACRALESDRPDALFQDPFAAALAGERGMAILQNLGRLTLPFGIAIRTKFMDRLVTETVEAHGIQTVLSLGCGLDSRPWRLPLPASLRWVEVDFPAMLDYKDSVLASAEPSCERRRLPADLSDPADRARAFAAAQGPTLVITEGLLMYLPAQEIAALAATGTAQFWMLEVTSRAFMHVIGGYAKSVQDVRAQDHLEGDEILDLMSRHGWVGMRHLNYGADIMAIASERVLAMFRDLPPEQMPKPQPDGDTSGVHLLSKTGT